VIENNDEEMEKNIVNFVQQKIENGTWDGEYSTLQHFLQVQLDKNLINPNTLLYPKELHDERFSEQIKFLLRSTDKRIKVDYSDYQWFKNFATYHEYEYDDGNKIFQLIINDKRINPNILFNYQSYYIVKRYLYILARSSKLDQKYYPELLELLLRSEKNEDNSNTFIQYAIPKLNKVLEKLTK
jgi:hypothetical protein